MTIGIKQAVQDWLNNRYENWIKQPIEQRTLELENLIREQVKQVNQYNPINFYSHQSTFARGLFWLAVLLVLILWLIN